VLAPGLCNSFAARKTGIPRTSRSVRLMGNYSFRADPARGSRKLPQVPANARNSSGGKPCSRRNPRVPRAPISPPARRRSSPGAPTGSASTGSPEHRAHDPVRRRGQYPELPDPACRARRAGCSMSSTRRPARSRPAPSSAPRRTRGSTPASRRRQLGQGRRDPANQLAGGIHGWGAARAAAPLTRDSVRFTSIVYDVVDHAPRGRRWNHGRA
jgi:hypothetical protein